MSILLIKNGKNAGKYRVRIQPVDQRTGKKVSIPSKVTESDSKTEARQIEKQMWQKYKNSKISEQKKLEEPFSNLFQQFVDDYHNHGRWGESTYYDWCYTARLVQQYFGRQKVRDVRESDIDDFAHHYV